MEHIAEEYEQKLQIIIKKEKEQLDKNNTLIHNNIVNNLNQKENVEVKYLQLIGNETCEKIKK